MSSVNGGTLHFNLLDLGAAMGSVVTSCLSLFVHVSVDEADDNDHKKAEESVEEVKNEPVIHVREIFSLLLSRSGCNVLGWFWSIEIHIEPADVSGNKDSDEVVHLEEETKSTLLELVKNREKLDHLVHSTHAEVDE